MEELPPARRLSPGVCPDAQPSAQGRPSARVVSTRGHTQGLPAALPAGECGPGFASRALCPSVAHNLHPVLRLAASTRLCACTPLLNGQPAQ